MGNMTILPEHIQLLNGLKPHLGKKGEALVDKILNISQLLTDHSGQEGLESIIKLVASTGLNFTGGEKQTGKIIRNLIGSTQKAAASEVNPAFLLFLILILLMDFR